VNPIAEFLNSVRGEAPSNAAIDSAVTDFVAGAANEINPPMRRDLQRVVTLAAARCAALWAEGDRGGAREHAAETVAGITEIAGPWSRPRDTSLDNLSGRETAALIGRRRPHPTEGAKR
jgi:hypothetical protein